jgi:hypothetical protein
MNDAITHDRSISSQSKLNQFQRIAIALRERGFAVHWLKSKSKAPLLAGWTTAPVMSADELITAYRPGYNIGIRCGRWSSPLPGCGLVILDVDIKDPDEACTPYEVLYRYFDIEHLFEAQSGSGLGRHQYFACPVDDLPRNTLLAKSNSKIEINGHHVEAWQIEILSTGRQVVAPPSIHPATGQPYKWLSSLDTELPLLPASILDAIEPEPTPAKAPPATPPIVSPSSSIADQFNAVTNWHQILEPYGWRYLGEHGERQHWRRPGKREGVSATTWGNLLHCFTTATEFKPRKGYSKFSAYSILAHNGNMSAAAKHLEEVLNG